MKDLYSISMFYFTFTSRVFATLEKEQIVKLDGCDANSSLVLDVVTKPEGKTKILEQTLLMAETTESHTEMEISNQDTDLQTESTGDGTDNVNSVNLNTCKEQLSHNKASSVSETEADKKSAKGHVLQEKQNAPSKELSSGTNIYFRFQK